jgi:PAS domain S-box-containing protein
MLKGIEPSMERDSFFHLRLLMDRIPSALAYIDKEMRCRFANQTLQRWLGERPNGFAGMTAQDMLGPELFALNKPHMEAVLKGEEQVFERFQRRPDGTEIHSVANYIPDIAEGEVVGFLVNVTDVTSLKRVEQSLQKELELRAQIERNAEELRSLLSERSAILDVLAHEVRRPLNTASAALQSAAAALMEATILGASEKLLRAQNVLGEVMASLDNTLAVTTLLTRAGPIEHCDTDIDTLIGVAIADMPEAERTRIRVKRNTSTRTASMDMSLMRLALRNLLSNALKYSSSDKPVTVHIADSDDPLALLIDVEDEGCGVDAELLPRLFERGARSRQAAEKPGQGLGLYIVSRVMKLHSGSVMLFRNTSTGVTMRLVIEQS